MADAAAPEQPDTSGQTTPIWRLDPMDDDRRPPKQPERPRALVWVDTREAIIVRWEEERAKIDRVTSEIPDQHRSMGHIRHDPAVRHGGGRAQEAEAARRLEYLHRFLKEVVHRVPPATDLIVLGPGTVHEHLIKVIRAADVEHHDERDVVGRRSSRLTDRQLVAALREVEGEEAPRVLEDGPRPPATKVGAGTT
jgi:stalled ribosome rescue protein Dom34